MSWFYLIIALFHMLISGGVKKPGFPIKGEFTHPAFPDLHFDVETIFAEPTP